MDKVVTHLDDIGYTVEVTPGEYHADVRVFKIVATNVTDDFLKKLIAPRAWEVCLDSGAYGQTIDMQTADVFLSGFVKWDGCSNLKFDEQDRVMIHTCSRQQLTNIGVLLGHVFDLAGAQIAHWDF